MELDFLLWLWNTIHQKEASLLIPALYDAYLATWWLTMEVDKGSMRSLDIQPADENAQQQRYIAFM